MINAETPRPIQPNAKLFATRCDPEPRVFLDVFHRWIQTDALNGVLIDVADYTHVHEGPGVLLVAHEAYWGMDQTDGRIGMAYRRRRGEAEDVLPALSAALRQTIEAAKLMESSQEGVTFGTDEVLLGFEDRLNAPNTAETFAAMKPALEQLAAQLYPQGATVEPHGDPRAPFRASIKAEQAPGLDALLERLG